MSSQQPAPDLPIAGDGTMPVPVYDCHVILSSPDEGGLICGRVSTLPQITARGRSERHVLQQIVSDFKAALTGYRHSGEPIPWQPAPPLQQGETQRWIPVHL